MRPSVPPASAPQSRVASDDRGDDDQRGPGGHRQPFARRALEPEDDRQRDAAERRERRPQAGEIHARHRRAVSVRQQPSGDRRRRSPRESQAPAPATSSTCGPAPAVRLSDAAAATSRSAAAIHHIFCGCVTVIGTPDSVTSKPGPKKGGEAEARCRRRRRRRGAEREAEPRGQAAAGDQLANPRAPCRRPVDGRRRRARRRNRGCTAGSTGRSRARPPPPRGRRAIRSRRQASKPSRARCPR